MAQGLDGIQMRGINDLALNYSKQQLAHLVQIGQLDPAKAMLAGMAIDRVKANAEKPPTATVFDDVLGQQAQQPQGTSGIASVAPQQGQQPQPQEGAGVSALPSGIEGMADGGIVGYADRGLVEGDDQSWKQVAPKVQQERDDIRYTILANELKQEQAKADAGDVRAKANVEALQREMRRMKPPVNPNAGVGALIPSAMAGDLPAPPDRPSLKPAPAPKERTKTARERLMEQQVMEDYGISNKPVSPELQKASEESAAAARAKQEKQKRLKALEGGPFSQRGMTEAEAAEAKKLRADIDAIKVTPVAPALVAPAPAATTTAPAGVAPTPQYIDARTQPEGQAAAPASVYDLPALSDPRYKVDVPTETAPVPKIRSIADITAEKTAEEQKAGVDTEVYSKMVESIGKKREDLAGRRGEAIGEAIMMAGLKLMGARKGQEFKALSEGAQEGLKQFAANMKEVKAAQDKYDERLEAYRLAENEAKRTGVTSAITTRDKERERLEAAEAENRKTKNRAAEVAATLGAGLKEADIRSFATLFGAQTKAEMSREEATKIAQDILKNRGRPYTSEQLRITTNEVLAGQKNTSVAPSKEVYDVEAGKLFGVTPTR